MMSMMGGGLVRRRHGRRDVGRGQSGMGAAFSMMSQASDAHARHGRRVEGKMVETVEDAMSKVGKQVGEELKKGSR